MQTTAADHSVVAGHDSHGSTGLGSFLLQLASGGEGAATEGQEPAAAGHGTDGASAVGQVNAIVQLNVGLHLHGCSEATWQVRGVDSDLASVLCELQVEVELAATVHPLNLFECLSI